MNKLSTKMKRMLAILLVEVIVATNVITSYAHSADEPFTMTEEEAAGAQEEAAAEEPVEEVVAVVEEEPVVEAPMVVEEPVVEAPVEEAPVVEAPTAAEAPAVEAPAAEVPGAEAPVSEVPGAEAPSAEIPAEEMDTETPAAEESGTEAPVEEETVTEETQTEAKEEAECICTEECTEAAYEDACAVCAKLADLETSEEKESYLAENCLAVTDGQEAEATKEPAQEETKEAIEEDNSVTVTGICQADGEVIEGTESFEISVDDIVSLKEEAPEVEGYFFAEEVTLENGDAISQIKKETAETNSEDGIVLTTSMSYTADAEWIELTEDITVVFHYTQEEETAEEVTEAVVFTATYIDQDGNAIEGYENETLSFEESMDLTKAPTTIDNYTYVEAKIDDTVVTSINKTTEAAEDENAETMVTYSYTADGDEVYEVTEDTVVTFVYETEIKEAVITMECVDAEGVAIEGYGALPLPAFEDELLLDDAQKTPYAIVDYVFTEAGIDDTVITSLVKETEEDSEAVTYSYVTADGERVAIEEDTVITLNYEEEELVVEVKASVVDNFGDPIDEKYTDMDWDEIFGEEEILTLDDEENPPVDKVQIRQSLFKVVKYTYVDATIEGEVIAALKRTATKETAEFDAEEQEYLYAYTTDGETWTKIKEDATVVFEYSDGKKSVYTYEDSSVMVTATLQHANAIPDDAQFVVTPVTPKSSDYNYDAYMDALNKNADKTESGEKAEYTEENTLLYDIAFLAAPVDEDGNVIEGELIEYQPAEGMVNISIVFKKKQLSKELEAEKAKDVAIAHLPLEDAVKEQTGTTADATDISASDVQVEKIDNASVALDKSGNDKVSFSASTFSVYAATTLNAAGATTTDTLISNGGAYTLEYILNNFQIVTLDGDLNLENHCMGAILVNGDQLGYSVGFADDMATAQRVSSYIKGTYNGAVAGRVTCGTNDESLKPLYIGTGNTVEYVYGQWKTNGNWNSQMKASDVLLTDDYVDWSALASALKAQSASISAGCTDTLSGSGTLTINAGDCVTINDLSGITAINVVGNMTDAVNTIINIPVSGDIRLPQVYINGAYAAVKEVDSGTAIAWNLPNATNVTVPSINWVGHIIAPDAHVFVEGGNYNGGIICKSMHSKGEGHVYPYNGGELIPTSNGFEATKTVDGQTPASGETFTFKFDELVSGSWQNLATASNKGKTISFPTVHYTEAAQLGDHWYLIYEVQQSVDGYSLSTVQYVVKDSVSSITRSNIEEYTVQTTYYKVTGSENGWVDPTSLISGSAVDTSKLTEVSGADAIVFNNSAAKKEISVTKVWNDSNNQDGKRPDSVTVQLKADGSNYGAAITLNSSNNWSHQWVNLPEKNNGSTITYTVEEVNVPDGYTVAVSGDATNGFTITNTHEVTNITINGTKVWDDNNNQDGKRPSEITVRLFANGTEVKSQKVTADASGNWNFTFADLPEYANGNKITYTVKEDAVADYTTAVSGDATNGFTITNTHEVTNITINGTKVWDDNNNQDGKRPSEITVRLFANGTEVKSQKVTADASGNWNFTFADLPEYANGNKITYTVKEDAVADYTVAVSGDAENGFTVTNTHDSEKINIGGTKNWDDNNNQDGKRPESITIRLYADGTEVASKTVTADEGWAWTFSGLDKFKTGEVGKEIVYTISEDTVAEYEPAKISGDATNGFTVVNTHTAETTTISGAKTWNDGDNQDGKRPTTITVKLLANNNQVASKVVTEADGWKWSFTELPKYENGALITYTVVEEAVEGYTPVYAQNGVDITNNYTPETTSMTVIKQWDDNNNQDGARPASVKVQLFANGEKSGSEVILNEENKWTYTWSDLAKNKAGKAITYTVEEVGTVAGYTTADTIYADGTTATIKNSYTPKTVDISGAKTWNDNDDQDGKRPDSITINLLANGVVVDTKTVTAESGWTWNFTGKPEYENGQKITYTITEDVIKGDDGVEYYTTSVNGYNVTNTHIVEKIDISGTKIWNDNNNQDGLRPTEIVVKLNANGKEVQTATVTADSIDADGNWTFSFKNLPVYESGQKIEYTVTEAGISGYTPTISGDAENGFVINNSHIPGETAISVKKIWNDNENQDGLRPGFIKVQLYKEVNGTKEASGDAVVLNESNSWSASWSKLPEFENGSKVNYTVEEVENTIPEGYTSAYTLDADGKLVTITNTHETEKTQVSGSKTWEDNHNQDGMRPASIKINLFANDILKTSKVVTADDNWSWTFDNLDKYENGKEIVYSITEDSVDNYTTSVNGYNVTNTHIVEKTEVSGSKVWDDKDNQDGARPQTITVNLLADGVTIDSQTISADTNGDWNFTFENLDKYKDGKEIKYTVEEEAVADYSTVIKDGNVIVNSHTPGLTTYSVEKVWDDNDNQDGKRVSAITVQLLANGEAVEGKSVELNESNNWKYTWTGLDEKKNGTKIDYSVEETVAVDGYTVSYQENENGTIITNTHNVEKTTISGAKTWVDNENQDGARPESITITLLGNGEEVASKTVTASDNWSWSFDNLDKYANGQEIIYTITENEVPGYETQIDGFNVTNTHIVEKTEVSGSKIWNDNNNQDGKRPESITINLLADGTKIDSQTILADAQGNWSYQFENLDKYQDGKLITYTVTEEAITTGDYTARIEGFTITNDYTPDTTAHTVKKAWADKDNQDGVRPDSVQVQLMADGKEQGDAVTLSASNGWSYTWDGLTKYRDGGIEIKYTAVEAGEVVGYIAGTPATANGETTITNTHETETVDISGSKVWNDKDNQDGVRPESITINLFADEVKIDSKTVTEADGWTWSFTGLDKYKAGKLIAYTITEDAVEGYDTAITGDAATGFIVTNTHETETVDISGSKVWNDADNQDGVRPESITVNLEADGKSTGKSVIITQKEEWKWSFTGLDKYKDGKEIVYTVTEDIVEGYSTEIDGYVITNSYTPGKTSHTVTKAWNDAENQDGKRPSTIQVQLKANGAAFGEPVTLKASENWTYTWTDLDLKSGGEVINYTVEEVGVPSGYTLSSNVTDPQTGKTTITNSYETEQTSVSGSKTWNDNNNQDGKRPESITINLFADDVKVASKTVTEASGWAWTFDGLDKYKAGKEIVYTITEDAVASYTSSVNGYDVTNTHEVEKTEVNGQKIWNDANNQDGVRPESITVNLLANGEKIKSLVVTPDAEGNWTWSFTELPKYENGSEITYSITEDKIQGADYQAVVDGYNITNNYTPGKTNLSVEKVWVDGENQDGIRPDSVTIQLYADGQPVAGKTVELNAANGWKDSFDDLDEKQNGQIIKYTAQEAEVPAGYTVAYDNTTTGTTIVTNTHATEEINITGIKNWDDNDNQDGKRPESITVNLLANGTIVRTQEVSPAEDGTWKYTFTNLPKKENGTDITYTVSEEAVAGYTAEINGTNITNKHESETVSVSGKKTWIGDEENLDARPESITINLFANNEKIDSKTVTEADGWTWSFADLDKYADGKEIIYTITEDYINGYSTDVRGNDVVNTYTPGYTSMEVTKIWDDNDNQDGKRPASIVVQLYEKYIDWGLIEVSGPKGEPITLSAENNWTATWENLPVKKQESDEVQYFVKEIGTIAGYETEIINGTDIKITNTYETETVKVDGEKIWNDNNNQDGVRPDSITVRIYDGETEVAAKTVTAADNWKWSFSDLPKYKSGGVEIVYTIKEDVVNGYDTTVAGDAEQGFTVTNSHETEKTEYAVEKVWSDENNQDGIRPESITVQLYADGKEVEGKSAVLNTENAWKATFTDLDKYADGKLIVYTVQETEVPAGYIMTVDHTSKEGSTVITNTHETDKVSVSGSKTWADAENQDGKRPASITIRLYADGTEVGVKEVTAKDGWKWSFDDLPKNEAGKEIVYTITEDEVTEYTTAVNGYDVTNTHEVEKIQLGGEKVWDDAENQDGERPESITVNLHADGEKVQSKTVTEADGWKYNFTDLDKYKDGKEIVYTISEDSVAKYTTVIEGTTITNSYTPGKTQHKVEKIWTDNNDQDGIRPASITVDLYADGSKVEGKSVELNAGNNWTYTWTELDEKKDGQKITYTAKESEAVAGYETTYNYDEAAKVSFITNTHKTEEIDITGSKTWEDNNNQDGKRPASITIRLYADSEEVDSLEVTPDADGNWTWSFENLPKYRDGGVEIVYSITEDAVADYTSQVEGYNVTNTHESEKVSVSGSKTWSDNADAEGVRPTSITIRLYADSEEVDSLEVTPDADGNWTWSFTDLDKYKDGQEINYTISEDKVIDYQSEVTGYDINNTYNPGLTQITVTKNWKDNNDQDGIRPDAITVKLMEKTTFFDQERDEVVLNESNNWSYTWDNLPDEKKTEKVMYYVKEVKVDGYESVITEDTSNITITNTHETETTEVTGEKTWNDNNNQDGKRPGEIVIHLLADGKEVQSRKVTAADDWKWSFSDLPKYRDGGVEIVYTITEDVIEEYDTEIKATETGYEVINTDEIDKTQYQVEKVWADENNQDGIRPESITVQLYADGKEVEGKSAVLNTENAWKATFTDLDKYADGKLIVYTVQETEVPAGYIMTVDHTSKEGSTVITNTHETDKVSVSGSKTWADAENQDGKRPASITIRLYADGTEVAQKTVTAADNWAWRFIDLPKNEAGKEIVYTITEDEVTEYTTAVNGYDVTNTHTPETVEVSGTKTWNDAENQDGKRPAEIMITLKADGEPVAQKTVTEADGWTWTFTDLPKYKDGGQKITYSVSEAAVAEYTTTYDGYNVVNSYTPGETGITVIKVWDDANDQDGKRPESIQVQLVADGTANGDPVTLNAGNSWTYTWTKLPEMKQGKKITYTVEEIMGSNNGYTSVTTGDAANGYTITNTHIPETVEVEGNKTWMDADNQDGKRPESITINLLADGELKESKRVTEADGWAWSFKDLPKYKDGGVEIVYTITENEVAEYTTEINGYDVVNSHTTETVEVSGSKTWNDNENAEGVRPTEIIINLLADGELVDSKTVTEADGWSWSFKDLDKYKDGVEIVYTITEEEVADYSTTVTGYDVTNDYTPEETKITVTKVWDDAEDQDGIRPDSIKVQLYEGVFARGEAVELNAENNWTYSWEKLPAKKFGLPVEYTVKEVDKIPGYTTDIVDGTSTTITNTHIPEVVEVKGDKTWDDANNQDGLRPESITINLYADGVLKESKTVTAADDWAWSFTDLPKNKNINGEVSEIVYTIEEVKVKGYDAVIEEGSYDVTNTHTPEVIDIEGNKTWNDAENQDGKRPASITIRLYADGKEIDSKTITAANDWKWSFEDLPKYKDGAKITYTITEDVVADYSTTYDGYNVTNSYTPEKTSRTVVKVWDDQNDRDNMRPGSIAVQLYADGSAYGDPVVLSKANGWTYTWSDLDRKKNGAEIVYTVVEISKIAGYTTTYSENTFTITNKHTVKETPTPTPNDPTPTPTPVQTDTPNDPTPTPTPDEDVLGAKRVEDGMVLGARRGVDYAVLGKRRRPATGDSLEIFVWIMALATSMGGVVTSLVMLNSNKKRRK